MKIRIILVFTALLLLTSLSANAQLIGEGDTLWYKSLYPNTISHVQFSPDGTKLGVFSSLDLKKYLNVYDVISGVELWNIEFPYFANNFQFSIDGDLIYVLTPSLKTIFAFSSFNGEVIEENKYGDETQQTYWNLLLTPDPNKFLLTSPTGKNAIYDKKQQKITIEKLYNDKAKAYSSRYSNYYIRADDYEDGGVWNFSIGLFDINTLELVSSLTREPGVIDAGEAKISYNGKYAATNFGGRALQIWDLEKKQLFKQYWPTFRNGPFTGGGPQYGLSFFHEDEILVNCGGYIDPDSENIATTITNFINDKRTLIYPHNGFRSIDINNLDTKLAGGSGGDIVVLKLRKDAVPVKEYSQNSEPEIYPNPATDYINIQLSNKVLQPFAAAEKIQIFDMLGIEVLNESIPTMTSTHRMNIEKLPAGVYFIRIGAKVEKLLKM